MTNPGRVLVVPGYSIITTDGRGLDQLSLSVPAETLCLYVRLHHSNYEKILLLGGWDSKLLPPEITIAEAMRTVLIWYGVPSGMIYMPEDVPALKEFMPGRDSAEEALALWHWLDSFGAHPPKYTFLVMKPWADRVKMIHDYLCLRTSFIEEVSMPFHRKPSFISRMSLQLAEWVAEKDPLGTKTFLGRLLFGQNRKKRSLQKLAPGKRWLIPDVPLFWST